MRVKVKNKSIVTNGNVEKDLILKCKGFKNKFNINNIYYIKGKRSDLDFLIKCEIHGWFTITKKAFRSGSGCKDCSLIIKNKKISDTLKKNHIKLNGGNEFIKKSCVECKNDFLVRNTKRERKKETCSIKCSKEQSSKRFKLQNKSKEFKKKRSDIMKKEYAENKRQPQAGFATWFKYKNFKVQGELEFEMCKALDKLSKSKKIHKWEYTNDRYPYLKLGENIATYILDFKVYLSKDIYFYIETKGFATLNDLYKWKRISSSHALKVFFQKEDLESIKKDPQVILNKKTISQLDIDKQVSSTNFMKKQLKESLVVPF